MSMEERIAKGEMPPESVNDIKAALMGPLSGIGDAVFLTTIRVVAAGIAISLAAQGNVLGPIISCSSSTFRSTSCACGASTRAMRSA